MMGCNTPCLTGFVFVCDRDDLDDKSSADVVRHNLIVARVSFRKV